MILYIENEEFWRIPRDIVRKVSGSWQYASSIRTKNPSNPGVWDIKWHRNIPPTSTNTAHPFWLYSINSNFSLLENTLEGNPGKELSFNCILSNPGNHGTYTTGGGKLFVYINAKDGNNFADNMIRSNFPLGVTPGTNYRASVSIFQRNNFGCDLSFNMGAYSAPTFFGADFKGADAVTIQNVESSPSSGTVNFDFTVPSNHFWMRPFVKLIARNVGTTFPNYSFNQWTILRTS